MTGHQALIFSRIRENQLDPAWTDFARQHDQQLVEQAALAKLASPSLFFSLPFNGSSLLRPIATDLTTWQLLQLAWVKLRSGAYEDLPALVRAACLAEFLLMRTVAAGHETRGSTVQERYAFPRKH